MAFVMVSIHTPVYVISDHGYVIDVFMLFMLVINNKCIAYCDVFLS